MERRSFLDLIHRLIDRVREGPRQDRKVASQFMLQEHSRMIDVYQDLHIQKNELLKIYLAFVSIPLSIVAIFLALYKYLDANARLTSLLGELQAAAVYLSMLLVFVGISVLMIMLKIRAEQYLYVKAVNGTRKYFRETYKIEEAYLALPSEMDLFGFGPSELSGRAFWEPMIVSFTTSALLAFLAWELVARYAEVQSRCVVVMTVGAVFIVSIVIAVFFIRHQLQAAIEDLDLSEVRASTAKQKLIPKA